MPGMADPDIAIDIDPSISGATGVYDTGTHPFAPRPRLASRTLGLIALDATVCSGAAVICHRALDTPSLAVVPIACLTLCLCLSFFERGLYAPSEVINRDPSWRRLVLAWLQAVATGSLLTFIIGVALGTENMVAGSWLPAFLVFGFVAIAIARSVRLRFLAGSAALNRTVIIGHQQPMHDLILRIRTSIRHSFDVIGVVEHTTGVAEPLSGDTFLDVPLFADLAALERMIRGDAVDTVVVALPLPASDQMRAIVQRISMAPVDVYIYPGMNGLGLPLRRPNLALDVPLLMACTRPIGGWSAFMKRAEDIVLSAAVLAFISPVLLAIAIAIKTTSKGPVFFRQRRLGYNNRVIEILKFRSMYTHLSDADAAQQSFRGDKRVTRVGAWLRKTSLDELPQLFNVLRGDMSLVGPRPHALATTAGGLALEEAVPDYPSRHRVKPGITGWAQINGYRGALDSVDKIVHRVNYDLYYIEHWSMALDLKILWRTAWLVFADDNAF